MKKIHATGVLMFILFLFATEANAQSKKYKIDKIKCMRAEISDPGEFYSTYEFSNEELGQLKAVKLTDAAIDLIKKYHTEEGWPAQLGNFDVRIANAEKIKGYVVYKVAEFGDKFLLVVPAKYNQSMGDGWAPAQDIYFVVGKSGVTEP